MPELLGFTDCAVACCAAAVETGPRCDWSTPESGKELVDGLIAGLDQSMFPNQVVCPIAEVKHLNVLDGVHFTGRVGDRHALPGDREGVVLHGPIEEQIVLAGVPVDGVVALASHENVPAIASTEDIVASITDENVITSCTIELIVTITTS